MLTPTCAQVGSGECKPSCDEPCTLPSNGGQGTKTTEANQVVCPTELHLDVQHGSMIVMNIDNILCIWEDEISEDCEDKYFFLLKIFCIFRLFISLYDDDDYCIFVTL